MKENRGGARPGSGNLDEIEELFYSESIEDLCEIFGLTLISEDK